MREDIEAAGATLLYLPQYSPDVDPIELAFAKFKSSPALSHDLPALRHLLLAQAEALATILRAGVHSSRKMTGTPARGIRYP